MNNARPGSYSNPSTKQNDVNYLSRTKSLGAPTMHPIGGLACLACRFVVTRPCICFRVLIYSIVYNYPLSVFLYLVGRC